MKHAFIAGLLTAAAPAIAQPVEVSDGTLAHANTFHATTIVLPSGPWDPEKEPATQDGDIRRSVYRIGGGSLTTLQLLEPLEQELNAKGFRTEFACVDKLCGGFDFRLQLDLIGEPHMHVDLGDFRYLLARREKEQPHTVSVVVSRDTQAGFVHITEVSEASPFALETEDAAQDQTPVPNPGQLTSTMLESGRAVLEDLDFETGAAELSEGPYASLAELSEWLISEPDANVMLVGHTDAVGSLEANTALSLRRARAVADRLVSVYAVPREQLIAEGAGYLSPRASNLTEGGRSANRRVEVVLLDKGG